MSRSPDIIRGYHAHVYFADEAEEAIAAEIRARIGELFDVALGSWRREPVGPHPRPMYQIGFAVEEFPRVVPWLMLNAGALSVLIHPDTGEHVEDHRDRALWIGEKLALDIAFLERGNTEA